MESNPNSQVDISRRISLLSVMIISVILSGCSVTYSFTGVVKSPNVKTLSVQYFQNRASLVQPGLSNYITDALIDKCKSQTKLNLVSGVADVNFDGEISEYNTRPLTVSADAKAAMNRFTISVKVKFTNSVEPDQSYDKTFSRYLDYDSNLELSSVEKSLSDDIVKQLVEDIFNEAFVKW